MKHILVTGGAGFIGSHTVKHLVKNGYYVSVIDDLSVGFSNMINCNAHFCQGDFADKKILLKIHKKTKIDVVFHFAAHLKVHESVTSPEKYFVNNVIKTKNLLQFCMDNKIGKILFSSSSTLYGNIDQPAIAGVTQEKPISPYGESKLAIEKELQRVSSPFLSSLSLRYFNVAGADQDGELGQNTMKASQLIHLASKAAAGKLKSPLKIFGTNYSTPDGTCIRDYIHIDDLCRAHLAALKLLLKSDHTDIFNVGYGRGFSVREVIDCMKKVSQKNFPVEEAQRRPGDPAFLIANSDRFRKKTGWEPVFDDLELICKSSYDWEKSL